MNHVCELLRARASEWPDRCAIVEPSGRACTFAELARAAAVFSGALDAWGAGQRLVLLVPMGVDLYVALLGIAWGGRTAVLVDPSADRRRIDGALARIGVHGLVGSRKAHLLRLVMPALRGGTVYVAPGGLGPLARRFPTQGAAGPMRAPPPGEPMLVTFTTGTTGPPKAIGRSHAFLLAQHAVLAGHMGLGPHDVDLPTLPVFLLNSLAAGATCVLPDGDLRDVAGLDPARIAARIRRHAVTTTSGSPAFVGRLASWLTDRGETLPLRAVFVGGARVRAAELAAMRAAFPTARLEVVYGSTEAEPIAAIEADEAIALGGDTTGACVGRPVDGIAVRLVDPATGAAATRVGEVQVAGDHVNQGYYQDRASDAENKVRVGDTVWHRTGDMAWRDAQGRLWLVGRVGEDVVGEWPFPVESRAEALAGVDGAALVAVGGAPVVAYVGAADPRAVSAALGLRAVAVAALPVDPRHRAKVDRAALARILAAGGE